MPSIQWMTKERINGEISLPLTAVGALKGKPKRAILGLHGFGDNAENFSHLFHSFALQDTLWIFLQGPRPTDFPGGGAQWFPLFSNPTEELQLSIQKIGEVFQTIKAHVCQEVWLLGFSQGAALALEAGLLQKAKGIVALSGFLMNTHHLVQMSEKLNKNTPIFLGHGLMDQVVLPYAYYTCENFLKFLNMSRVTSRTYPRLGHSIAEEEIKDINNFFAREETP